MHSELTSLRAEAENAIRAVTDSRGLDDFRVAYLARKGAIAAFFDRLKTVPAQDRPALGKLLNELRSAVQQMHDEKSAALLGAGTSPAASLDLTLPGRRGFLGTKHPLTQTLDEIKGIFVSMGFGIADGPEIEDDHHNFEALNFPPDHPARDMQDTFFLSPRALLRTHTSPVQIRVMEEHQPPVRVIMPGRVYRNEAISARSYCMFHQVEGLCVDRGVTFGDLKGTLIEFITRFYGPGLKFRFRPTYLRGEGVPPVQTERVARDPRVRDGGSERVPFCRVRPGGDQRVRIRDGDRPGRHAPARHRRHTAIFRERRAFP
jgi:phenylalanyl-tRNA synthetase alpha chain